MPCPACGRSFHRECLAKGGCKKCHPKEEETPVVEVISTKKELLDPESTGRKRAAKIYPIQEGAPCEWQGKKNCGGGLRPVIGCLDGIQQHRHHGPVKKTTQNKQGNVHRICDDCHIHWHELNDLIYDESAYNLLPHDPEPAEATEIMENLLDWKSGEMGRKFQLASTQNQEKYKKRMLDNLD